MRYPCLAVIAIFFLPLTGFAQFPNQAVLDSLGAVLRTAPPDTQRARLQLRLGNELINAGLMDSARIHLDDALALADMTGNMALKAKALNVYGVSHFYQGRAPEALKYWEQALALAEPLGDERILAMIRTNLANAQQTLGNYPTALETYLDVLRYFEDRQDSNNMAMTFGNIGVLYGQMEESGKAKDYLRRALAIDSASGNTMQEVRDRINLAESHIRSKDFAEAEALLVKALELSRRMNHLPVTSQVLLVLGNLRMEEFRLSEAIDYLQQSNVILATLGDTYTLATNQGRMAVILTDMVKPEHKAELDRHFGGDARKALASARAKIDSSLIVMEQYGDLAGQKVGYQVLSLVHAGQGDYQKALDAYTRFKMLSDTLLNIERDKKITETAMQYTFDKQQAVARVEQEKKDARQATIRNSIAGGLGGALIFLFVVVRQRNRISREKQRSEDLLLNILPEEVAEELKAKGAADARHFDQATILFTDFKDFTTLSERMTPADLVDELNTCFKMFDSLMTKYGIEKIKTIGDAYMAAGGLPSPEHGTPDNVVRAALDMQAFMTRRQAECAAAGRPYFEMRAGIHTGPVVAGIVGVKKFQYDIWGDTVNMAARMESAGEVGRVNISMHTWQAVQDSPGLTFTHRGKVQAKGKGEVDMWFVDRATAVQ